MNSSNLNTNSCLARIKQFEEEFTKTSRRISDQILLSPETMIHMTIVQAANQCDTSEASIVRFCKSLGYNGFNDLKIRLATELSLENEPILAALQPNDDDMTVLSKVFAAEIKAIQDTAASISPEAFKQAVSHIVSAKKVEFYACGNSRPITYDAHYRMLKIGINSYIGINVEDSLMHANMMAPGDVAIAVSHTGSTRDTCMALEAAHDRGAITICVTAFPHSHITQVSDICLLAKSEDSLDFQTTTTTSRTAEMAIMDALYTAVAFRKGESAKQYIHFTDRILNSGRY